MFLLNKYTTWYYRIIERAHLSNRTRKQGYFERHHIIPKSLGGENSSSNLVLLTAREHYICHLLLCKMLEGDAQYKMLFACSKLAGGTWYLPEGHFRSRTYKAIRERCARESSKRLKGKPKTEQHKQHLRQSFKQSSLHKEAWQANIKKAQQQNTGQQRPNHSLYMKTFNSINHNDQFQWFNERTGDTFTGSRIELSQYDTSLRLDELWKVTKGKARSHKGWVMCSKHF